MLNFFILQTAALLVGFILDFIIGDPHCIPHPICAIGNLIAALDRKLRRGLSEASDRRRGVWTVVLVTTISTLVPVLLLVLAWVIHPLVYFALESIMCAQILAARQLVRESRLVEKALLKNDTEGARYAVSMIVGRDTDVLDESGICRAAIETVAENASDGVIAPLFYMLFFGAAGGFFYKSVNTMDSMLGYKNEKYLWFGRAAARLDDVVNFVPARLAAVLMILAAPLCGQDGKNARKIFRRDRFKHASPNSAQTESVCAGALRIRLAGDACYGGVWHKKEYIGDDLRPVEAKDITRSGVLMYVASALMLLCALLLRSAVILCF